MCLLVDGWGFDFVQLTVNDEVYVLSCADSQQSYGGEIMKTIMMSQFINLDHHLFYVFQITTHINFILIHIIDAKQHLIIGLMVVCC